MPQTKNLPIFENYSLSYLAERLPMYEESTLLQFKRGWDKPTEKFIKTACGILNRTREELFGAETE